MIPIPPSVLSDHRVKRSVATLAEIVSEVALQQHYRPPEFYDLPAHYLIEQDAALTRQITDALEGFEFPEYDPPGMRYTATDLSRAA